MEPCLSTTIFGRVPLDQTLKPIAAAGFKLIELSRNSSERAKQKNQVEDLGLSVWAVHGTFDVQETDERTQMALDNELRAMDALAIYAPCPYVVHYKDLDTDNNTLCAWQKSIKRLHENAAARDFVLAVEPTPAGREHITERGRVATGREVAEFVRAFHSDHLGVCLDLNHTNLVEKIPRAAADCKWVISNIHVSDNHGLCEEHLPPGDGIIEFPAAFKALVAAGYTGPINMEVHVRPTTEVLVQLRQWAETARQRCIPSAS